jgi:GNAT superfamily N-acetyltransferase
MDSMVECIDRPQTFFGLCGFRDGELVGLKYAYATQYFFSTDIVCYDLATYVTPSARSFALIKMMIREYIRWSKLVGAKRVYLGATSMPGDPRVGTLFTKLGFEPAGSLHVMEIDYGQRLAATG